MFEPKKDESALDALKKRLYTRGELGRRSLRLGRLHDNSEDVKNSWGNESPDILPSLPDRNEGSVFKKFFIGSAVFFILAATYAAYQFFAGGNIVSSKNIDLTVFGPAFVSGGDELSLQVSIQNRNSVPLEYAELLIEYQKGAGGGASSTQEMVRQRMTLKKIPSGGTDQEVVKATLYGEEGQDQNIKFTLEYRVQGSNAIFQKESLYPVKISSAPLNLSMDAPSSANSGQEITFTVKASSNAPKDVPGVLLKIDYPPGFMFKSADPKPAYDNNVWSLGDFHTGSSRTIKITGVISGQNGEERTLRVSAGSISTDDERSIGVIYNSLFQTIAVRRPFLDAVVSLNSDSSLSVAVPSAREVKGHILWKNNLPTRIQNAQIKITFSGNAFNKGAVYPEHGYYDSSSQSVVWDKNTTDDFSIVEPGASGQLSFTFIPAQLFSGGNIINSPQIDLETSVSGEVPGGTADNSTSKTSAKISTDIGLLSRGTYSTGPFKNTGPIPPVAEKETTYTVTWTITNSANNVSNAAVTTTLPLYVSWMNQVLPKEEDVSYDENLRTVTWKAHTISSGTGYGRAPREVSFQLKLKPSISHLGSTVSLTGDVSLSGSDAFSMGQISYSKDPLTTTISSDPIFKPGSDIVVSSK